MLYAKVVLGLPVEGPFDYRVNQQQTTGIGIGFRVLVNFRNKKEVGYVVGLASQTRIKNVKDILDVIDKEPILDKKSLSLAEKIADYYCCSLGEAIEAMLPAAIRKGTKSRK